MSRVWGVGIGFKVCDLVPRFVPQVQGLGLGRPPGLVPPRLPLN